MQLDEIYKTWESGKASEVDFWDKVAKAQRGSSYEQYRNNLIARARPDAPFLPTLATLLKTSPELAVVIDLAAGPISTVGWKCGAHHVKVHAFDVLANEYEVLLNREAIAPFVKTQFGEAERIHEYVAPESADLVYIRNALDHCYDVPAVFEAALKILKPNSPLVIFSHRNEADKVNYNGLHQWNLDVQDGRFIVWRPDTRIDVVDLLAGRATVQIRSNANNWLEIVITKN